MDDQPGGSGASRLLRVVGIVIVALAVLAVLFLWVFPWVEGYLEDPTLDAGLGLPLSAPGHG